MSVKIAFDSNGNVLFATNDIDNVFLDTLIKYCKIFNQDTDDCFSHFYLAKGNKEDPLWLVSDDSGDVRFFQFGKPELILDAMKNYIQKFAKPKGSSISQKFIKQFYTYNDSEIVNQLHARPIPYRHDRHGMENQVI